MTSITNKKNYLLSLSSGFAGMAVANIIALFTVPISLNYWKVEKYGLWALLTSVIVYLNMTNLGLNAAAGTLMAKSPLIKDKLTILRRSLHILLVSAITALVLIIGVNVYSQSWIVVLGKIPADLHSEAYYSCLLLTVFFIVNMPFGLLTSILNGFQKAYIENTFSLLQSVLNFVSLLVVIWLKGSLITFAFMNGSIMLCLNIIKLVYTKTKVISAALSEVQSGETFNVETSHKSILITGLRFFVIGIASMIIWNTDNFVISHFLGLNNVTAYSITFKLYYVFFNMLFIINTSLGPLLGKELGNNNWEWLNRTYKNVLTLVTIIGGATWLFGILFFRDILDLWTSGRGNAGLLPIFTLGGYSYLVSMVSLNSIVIVSFNYLKNTVFVIWMEAAIKLIFSILMIKYMGIAGIAMGTFLGSLLAPAWLYPLIIRRGSESRIKFNAKFVIKHLVLIVMPTLFLGLCVQFYIESMALRVSLGIGVIMVYLIVSHLVAPAEFKYFIKDTILRLKKNKFALLPRTVA